MKLRPILALTAVVLTACSGPSTAAPSTVAAAPSTTTPASAGAMVDTSGLPVEVFAPDTPGEHPVVVTVHGGGWVSGDPAQMAPLAADLADRGMVVFNITYEGMNAGGRYPGMVQDVACGITAAMRAAPEYTSTPDDLWVVAHSAGAHLAALVAMAPEEFPCPDGSVADARGLVGLAGPYDVTRIAILNTLFGATLEEDPDLWAQGNPRSHIEGSPEIPIVFIHGDADEVVPLSFSTELAADLEAAGRAVEVITLPGATHSDVRDPAVVGELVAGVITDPA